MSRSYFLIAWRNLTKNKVSSFINIGGLAIGMTVAMLIGLWIYSEVSFDRYHADYGRIGRIMVHNGDADEVDQTYEHLPEPLAQELRTTYGRYFKYVVISSGSGDHILSAGDKKFTQSGDWVSPQAPDLLTLKMLEGSRAALGDMHSILLSSTIAQKLFGTGPALGKVIRVDNTTDVTVTGVYEDIPDNSSFHESGFLLPWDLLMATNDWVRGDLGNWKDNSFLIYVELAPGATFEAVSAHIQRAERSHLDKGRLKFNPALFVHPMRQWHLHSHFEYRAIATSEALKFVWFYALIGVFVLLLACINFMNLSTARSEGRARETGVRKTMGAPRWQLVLQFFSESLLIAVLAAGISLGIVQLLLPWFSGVAAKHLVLPWASPWFWAALLVFTLVTGLLAGSYPALYLSSFRPVKVLKGVFRAGRLAALPRQTLVVFQFTVSIALVMGTLIVYRQIQYAKDRPVGYQRAGLIQVPMTTPDFQGKYDVLTQALQATGVVASMAESSLPVTATWSNTGGITWRGMHPDQESDFGVVRVSPEYGKTMQFQVIQGRDFSREFPTDSAGIVINEAAAKYMGLAHAAGETVHWKIPDGGMDRDFKIVGVVRDMVMNSPFEKVKQYIYWLGGDPSYITIRIRPDVSPAVALPKIEAVFRKLIPDAPFNYAFTDETYATKFAAEERVGTLASFFTVLAILISCLGLFGLASFVAEQRTKEIGIRKVLGASVWTLWRMLSLDFVRLVVLAALVALPLAYTFMRHWLEQYEYRSSISWALLAGVCGGALLITLGTVSYQAVRAALANPVKSLRTE